MEPTPKDSPCVTYYDSEHHMQIILTSTNEKTFREAEDELVPLLEKHYINRVLGTF